MSVRKLSKMLEAGVRLKLYSILRDVTERGKELSIDELTAHRKFASSLKESNVTYLEAEEALLDRILGEAAGLLASKKVQTAVKAITFSDRMWDDVDVSKLSDGCFLYTPDVAQRSGWRLPYREGSGVVSQRTGMYEGVGAVNKGAVQTLLVLKAGAVGGVKGIEEGRLASIWDKVDQLAEQGGVGTPKIEAYVDWQSNFATYGAYTREPYVETNMTEQEYKASFDSGGSKELKEELVHIDCGTLAEATIDSKEKTVTVTVIKPGWSKNNNYWSPKVIEAIATAAGLDKKKVYLNHELDPSRPRNMFDWAGHVLETSMLDGAAKAKVHVFDKPDGEWLWERVLKFPNEVGVSVDVRAKVKKGEAEGRKGTIVEEIVYFRSFDFVATPAAGGRVENIAAAEIDWEEEQIDTLTILEQTLKGQLAKEEARSKFWKLQDALSALINQIAWSVKMKADEKKKAIVKAVADFEKGVNQIDFVAMTSKIEAKRESNQEEVSDNVQNVAELLTKFPEIAEEFKGMVIREYEEEQKVSEITEENKTLKADLADVKKKLDEFEVKETAATREAEIAKELKASKLEERFVTDVLMVELRKCETPEERQGKIKDRIAVVEAAQGKKGVKGMGVGEGEKQEETKALKDEDAVKTLKE